MRDGWWLKMLARQLVIKRCQGVVARNRQFDYACEPGETIWQSPASSYMNQTIFEKIPVDHVYEDELARAFRDIHPHASPHVLIVPHKPILRINEAAEVARRLGLNSGLKS